MDRLLETPIDEARARDLRAGDVIYLSGTVFTARDEAHALMLARGTPLPTEGLALYHCGPLVQRTADDWRVIAAGPTTSARLEMFEPEFLRRYKPRLVIGKGGMGAGTLAALGDVGAAYCHLTGGAGALAAAAVARVSAVRWLDELAMPEAIWVLSVERLGPLVVAMDAHGRSLYAELAVAVERNMATIRERIASG